MVLHWHCVHQIMCVVVIDLIFLVITTLLLEMVLHWHCVHQIMCVVVIDLIFCLWVQRQVGHPVVGAATVWGRVRQCNRCVASPWHRRHWTMGLRTNGFAAASA